MDIENAVVLITGAAERVGRAVALYLAERGAHIAFSYYLDDEPWQQTLADIRALGVEALAVQTEVRDKASVQRLVDETLARFGRIDVLLNNASVWLKAPFLDITEADWDLALDVNLKGPFLCAQAVAPIMLAQQSGSIINLSSMAGKTSWPATAAYSASKSGVIGLTRSVAMELAPYGVTVNAVCPGHVLTPMMQRVAEKAGPRDGMTAEAWLQMRAQDCPQKRMAEPWEIAGIVAFLASNDARYITGQAIEADGGMVMS